LQVQKRAYKLRAKGIRVEEESVSCMKRVFVAAGVILIALSASESVLLASGKAQEGKNRTGRITVVGEGEVSAVPDRARVQVGVQEIGRELAEVIESNQVRMAGVMTALTALGVQDKDIQTTGYTVYFQQERPQTPGQVEGVEGYYHVSNTLSVTIRNLDEVGSILDAAVEAGANSIQGISFYRASTKELLAQARMLALEDARNKAEGMAAVEHLRLGRVLTISEELSGQQPLQAAVRLEAAGPGTSVSPGVLEYRAVLRVEYGIRY
jgi:uncharacterized protein YggE